MAMVKEMQKLRQGLTDAGIEWEDASEYTWGSEFTRTHFTNRKGEKCSVIHSDGISMGAPGGFLESMPPVHRDVEPDNDELWQDEVEGYLTAEEILEAWA